MSRLTFLITAGPTQEPLDPVRYLSNYSSGKMGYALATAAKKKGHQVILISGPTSLPIPKGVKLIRVKTAREMYRAVFKLFSKADVIIKTAAVADYRPLHVASQKIKKTGKSISIKLVPNPDILKQLGQKKKKHQLLVGFAAETKNSLQNARKKLIQKNCDWIVLNDVGKPGIGFGSDQNEVTLLPCKGKPIRLARASKKKIASEILNIILQNHGSLRLRRTGMTAQNKYMALRIPF